jgi:hypothetical protein
VKTEKKYLGLFGIFQMLTLMFALIPHFRTQPASHLDYFPVHFYHLFSWLIQSS